MAPRRQQGQYSELVALAKAAATPAVIVACCCAVFLSISNNSPTGGLSVDGKAIAAQVRGIQIGAAAHAVTHSAMLHHQIACTPDPLNSFHPLQLRQLASYSDDPWPAVTRVLFTQADLDARR